MQASTNPQLYRRELDGLRAIAILAVVITHCNAKVLPHGYLGVDIFFVISGYVITASLASHQQQRLTPFLLDFYARRLRRLLPALVACVLVSAILISLVNPQPGGMLGMGWRAVLGASNLQLYREASDYFSPASDLNIYTHTWSLGVEWQFYLLFPLLAWGCGLVSPVAPQRHRLLVVTLIASAASAAAFVWLQGVNQPAAFYLMPPRFWEIGAGAVLWLIQNRRPERSGEDGWLQRLPPLLPLAGLIAVLALPGERQGAWPTLMAVLATVALIASVRPATPCYRVLSWTPLVGLGLISYSLYLWHWPVLVISRWSIGIHAWSLPFQLGLMLLLAVASWRVLERPLRQASFWRQPRRALAVSLGVVVAAAAWLLVPMKVLAARLFLGDPRLAAAAILPGSKATAAAGTSLNAENCLYPAPPEALLTKCRLRGRSASSRRLIVLGDSHAVRLFPLLGDLHEQRGWEVIGYGAEGQPFPALPYVLRSGRVRSQWQQVQERSDQVLSQALRQLRRGDVLMLKSFLDLYLIDDAFFVGGRRDRDLKSEAWITIDADAARASWLRRLTRLADQVAGVGAKLVVVAPHPVFPGSLESVPAELCLPMWFRPRLASGCPSAYSVERRRAINRITPLLHDLRETARSHPSLLVFEPFDLFCPPSAERCTTVRDGRILYTDNNHLSRDGSMYLDEPFKAFLSSHGL